MTRACATTRLMRPRAAGLTLVELLLAISVTAMVGMGVASMISVVGTVAQQDREGRSVLLRAHASQLGLRAYIQHSRCALAISGDGTALALWFEDPESPGTVNSNEVRIIWFNAGSETISIERVEIPHGGNQYVAALTNTTHARNTDFFALMNTRRGQGWTRSQTLISGVTSVQWAASDTPVRDATRLRVELTLRDSEDNQRQIMNAFGFAGHSAPTR